MPATDSATSRVGAVVLGALYGSFIGCLLGGALGYVWDQTLGLEPSCGRQALGISWDCAELFPGVSLVRVGLAFVAGGWLGGAAGVASSLARRSFDEPIKHAVLFFLAFPAACIGTAWGLGTYFEQEVIDIGIVKIAPLLVAADVLLSALLSHGVARALSPR